MAAKATGVNGYCPKGISISQLVPIVEQVANGSYYWPVETKIAPVVVSSLPFAKLRQSIQASGINYINYTLDQVTEQLKLPGISLLNQVILAGRQRELLAARWCVNHL
ncbi:MAG: DUF3685 domain-containing protein, partial [Dolichospermum sp.]